MSYSGYLYAIGAAVTWGLVYTIDQRILRGASPFALLFVDSLITTLLLVPVIVLDRGSLSSLSTISGKLWIYVVVSLILAALANLFIFSSIRIIGAAPASFFEIAYPFFVVIFSYFAFQAAPSALFVIGGILIFVGAALIVFFAH